MGAYLDRLNEQFDEIRTGIDELVNRAADENRDVTDDEQKRVDRDRARMIYHSGGARCHPTPEIICSL